MFELKVFLIIGKTFLELRQTHHRFCMKPNEAISAVTQQEDEMAMAVSKQSPQHNFSIKMDE